MFDLSSSSKSSPDRPPNWANRAFWVTFALVMLSLVPARAGSINVHNGGSDVLLMADGATALDNSFSFELGSFGSFLPTLGNLDDWMTNWKPFARGQAPAINGWNSNLSYFDYGAVLDGSGQSSQGLSADIFAEGEAAYLWVYNSFSLAPDSQWALVTNDDSDLNAADNWLFPDPDSLLPTEFDLATAYNPIMGGLHNVQGGGDFTAPLTAFTLQAHVVPEPTGAVLIMVAGVLWRVRRGRRGLA